MQRTSFKGLELYDFNQQQRPVRPTSCYHGQHLCPCCEHAYGRAMDKWVQAERERRYLLDISALSVPERIRAMWDEHVAKHGIPSPVGNSDRFELGYVPRLDRDDVAQAIAMPRLNKIHRYIFDYSESVQETYIVHKWTCEGLTLWEKIGKRT